ncbi:hypothetical protein EAI_03123 [Harpegnathos saltator]|uniref:Optineurin n=2 Tax=Harpegnathos saltator TaxID=610380 RepID=E2B715_HARSA|nr:hypothetical protein EAI_03123 [Harpegnathos saltator]
MHDEIRDIFVNYQEALYMVDLTMDESLKMTNAQDDDNTQEQTEVQQKLKALAIEQNKIQKQKKELEEKKHELDLLSNTLDNKSKHIDGIYILRDQLIRRKKLYDGKVQALLNERQLLLQDQKIDVADMLEKYKQKDLECKKLQQQLDQSILDISLYKNQLSMYEEDFKQEKNVKELLQLEKSKLNTELEKLVTHNRELTSLLSSTDIGRIKMGTTSQNSNKEVMQPCPKCETAFATLMGLTEHIEQCLNLI